MYSLRSVAVLLLCLSMSITSFAGRKRGNAPDPSGIQLPSDFNIDYKLALDNRPRVTGGAASVNGTELNSSGDEVFGNLTRESMVSGLGLPYRWRLSILNDNA